MKTNLDFIEIKVDFIEKKVGKKKENQTWPYYASVVMDFFLATITVNHPPNN